MPSSVLRNCLACSFSLHFPTPHLQYLCFLLLHCRGGPLLIMDCWKILLATYTPLVRRCLCPGDPVADREKATPARCTIGTAIDVRLANRTRWWASTCVCLPVIRIERRLLLKTTGYLWGGGGVDGGGLVRSGDDCEWDLDCLDWWWWDILWSVGMAISGNNYMNMIWLIRLSQKNNKL